MISQRNCTNEPWTQTRERGLTEGGRAELGGGGEKREKLGQL